MNALTRLATAVLMASAAACGGGGGDAGGGVSNQYCHTVASPGSGATCSNTCVGIANPGAAFDGSFASAAEMPAGTEATFSGTATTQPGGSVAGVYFVFPAVGEGISVTITTYLNGVQQETAGPATRAGTSSVCPDMDCSFTQGPSFVGLTTTKAYDTIAATISNTGAGGLRISELCVR